ncbi:MAG: hypothetical protein ACI9BW_004346, partial [Gammaproteobacteria bacterium]
VAVKFRIHNTDTVTEWMRGFFEGWSGHGIAR